MLVFGSVDGEVASIIYKTKSGIVIEYEDFDKIYNCLEKVLNNVHNKITNSLKTIKMYDRRNLTKCLVELFDSLI